MRTHCEKEIFEAAFEQGIALRVEEHVALVRCRKAAKAAACVRGEPFDCPVAARSIFRLKARLAALGGEG